MAAEYTSGKTEGATMESGVRTTCRATATMYTLMASSTMASIPTTRRKATVSTTGQMAVDTRAGGTRESNTDLESTPIQSATLQRPACGSLESALNGSAQMTLLLLMLDSMTTL